MSVCAPFHIKARDYCWVSSCLRGAYVLCTVNSLMLWPFQFLTPKHAVSLNQKDLRLFRGQTTNCNLCTFQEESLLIKMLCNYVGVKSFSDLDSSFLQVYLLVQIVE